MNRHLWVITDSGKNNLDFFWKQISETHTVLHLRVCLAWLSVISTQSCSPGLHQGRPHVLFLAHTGPIFLLGAGYDSRCLVSHPLPHTKMPKASSSWKCLLTPIQPSLELWMDLLPAMLFITRAPGRVSHLKCAEQVDSRLEFNHLHCGAASLENACLQMKSYLLTEYEDEPRGLWI